MSRQRKRRITTLEELLRVARPRPGEMTYAEAWERDPAYRKMLERIEAPLVLAELTARFRRSRRNPLFAWEAWRECRRHGLALPSWAAETFDDWAKALEKLGNDPDARPEDLPGVLGIAAREERAEKSRLLEYREVRRNIRIACAVHLHHKGRKLSETAAIRAVADAEKLSETTVRGVYKQHREALPSAL